MNPTFDRSAPGVRVVALPDERAVGGEPVQALQGRIESFKYEDSEKKTDKFTLVLNNEDLALFDVPELMGGSVLEVSWGYPGHMAPPRRCVVKTVKGFTRLTIEGFSEAVLMGREEKARSWTQMRRSDVARSIAREMGYEGEFAHIEDTEDTVETINQLGETDARLLRRLASEEEFEFYVDDTGLHWHRRRLDEAPTHTIVYHHDQGRGDITNVNVESDLLRRVGKVKAKGRDPETKEDIDVEATSDTVKRTTLADVVEVIDPDSGRSTLRDPAWAGSDGPVWTGEEQDVSYLDERNATTAVQATTAASAKDAKRKAGAAYRRAEAGTVKLTFDVVGDASLRAKAIVELQGIGSMLSGKYYLKEVVHQIDGSGYKCSCKSGRDGKSKLARKPEQGDGKEQGGTRNTAEQSDVNELSEIEMVDPETGSTELVYLQGGVPTWRVETQQSVLE